MALPGWSQRFALCPQSRRSIEWSGYSFEALGITWPLYSIQVKAHVPCAPGRNDWWRGRVAAMTWFIGINALVFAGQFMWEEQHTTVNRLAEGGAELHMWLYSRRRKRAIYGREEWFTFHFDHHTLLPYRRISEMIFYINSSKCSPFAYMLAATFQSEGIYATA